MVAYTGFYAHPESYWNVYSNKGGWGASCLTGLNCKSGCCSSEKLASYSYSYYARGSFCLNYAAACGFGPAGYGDEFYAAATNIAAVVVGIVVFLGMMQFK